MRCPVALGFALLVSSVALGSCGDDSGGSGGGAPGDLATLADAWCPTYAARYCAAAQACGCRGVPGYPGQDAACADAAEQVCRAQFDAYARFASALEVASEVPPGCLPALDAALAECRLPETELFIVRCPFVWPKGASRTPPGEGERCFDGLCAEGARCNADGLCAVPQSGGGCVFDGDCAEGERCGVDGRCAPIDLSGPRASCRSGIDCRGDLACLASPRRECRPKESGSSCFDDGTCVAAEYCDEGQCVPAPGLGAECGAGVACAPGLACRFAPGPGEGTCQPMPGAGDACALGRFGPFVCGEGLACVNQECGAPPGQGETCALGVVLCAEGLGCHFDQEQSVCRPRVAEGAPCGLDDSCSAGLFCDFGTGACAPFYASGEPCTAGNECGDQGACVPDEAMQFRCVPKPGAGEACFLDDSCQGELACRSPYDAGQCAPPMCAAIPF